MAEAITVERVALCCKKTGKLLARISLAGTWPADLRQWLWCRNCHMEHEITTEHIQESRNHADHR